MLVPKNVEDCEQRNKNYKDEANGNHGTEKYN